MDHPPRAPGFDRMAFALDRRWVFLNHGSFGAVPVRVRDVQARWRAELEAQPVRFLARRWWTLVAEAREPVARFLGARPDDIAFISNATAGVQAVVRSQPFDTGDSIVTTNHRYDAVHRILLHATQRVGGRLVEVDAGTDPSAADLEDAVLAACDASTRLVVLDSVTSSTARVLPLDRVVPALRDRGIRVLVDGAHAPGLVDVDLTALGADYWVGNLHKWLCAPRGTAVLHVDPAHHTTIRAPITSHGHGQGFHAEFDWTGTFDPSAWLSAPAAIDQHIAWGGARFRQEHRVLAGHYRDRLCSALGIRSGYPPCSPHPIAMVSLPLGVPAAYVREGQNWLAERYIEAPLFNWGGEVWIRVSAFAAYNTIGDIEALVPILSNLRVYLDNPAEADTL